MKQIIAVDADDTIFDENTAILEFHNKTYGTTHTLADYLRPGSYDTYWQDIWRADEQETRRRYEEFIAHKLEHNIPPIPDALAVLVKLKRHYDLVVVTSRDERSVAMTHQALTEHFPAIFHDVHFVPLWEGPEKVTKALICREIGADYLIDDSFEHCSLAAKAGLQALLYGNYGWNNHQPLHANMARVSDWPAVWEYFDGRD